MGFMHTGDDFHTQTTKINYYTHRQLYDMLDMSPTPIQEHLLDGVLDTLHAGRQAGTTTGLMIFAIYLSQFNCGTVRIYVRNAKERDQSARVLRDLHERLHPHIDYPKINTYTFTIDDNNAYATAVAVGFHKKVVRFGYGDKHSNIKDIGDENSATKTER